VPSSYKQPAETESKQKTSGGGTTAVTKQQQRTDKDAPQLVIEVLPPSLEAEEMLSPAPSAESMDVLLLGEYKLDQSKEAIIDGDTVRVVGLDSTLRLVGFDAEETFKKDADRSDAAGDFKAYSTKKRGDKRFPVKYGTEMGEEAARWARDFFVGVDTVRLEYDDSKRTIGVYGRHLVYVFVKRDGEWLNYNVEAVRAGTAPYFPKYGYSRRFHDDFVAAQREAQEAKRGIWGSEFDHYPDYDERLDWWTRRANAIVRFENKYSGDADVYALGNDGDELWTELIEREGEVVTVFGTISAISRDDTPYLVRMSHTKGKDFSIVAFTDAELEALQIDAFDGEYFYVRGKLSTYNGRPQFRAENVERIWVE
jgi:endonuclease YncB( thermonuclease family)